MKLRDALDRHAEIMRKGVEAPWRVYGKHVIRQFIGEGRVGIRLAETESPEDAEMIVSTINLDPVAQAALRWAHHCAHPTGLLSEYGAWEDIRNDLLKAFRAAVKEAGYEP